MDGIADSRALQRSGHRQGCVAVKRIASRIGQHRSVRLTAMLADCALLSAAPNEALATDPGGDLETEKAPDRYRSHLTEPALLRCATRARCVVPKRRINRLLTGSVTALRPSLTIQDCHNRVCPDLPEIESQRGLNDVGEGLSRSRTNSNYLHLSEVRPPSTGIELKLKFVWNCAAPSAKREPFLRVAARRLV